MKMTLYPVELPLMHPFTIARGTINTQPAVIVELDGDGIQGYGEVSTNTYYGHSLESIMRSLSRAAGVLEEYRDRSPEAVWQRAHDAMQGDRFALSALDVAAHDWHGKRFGQPVWKSWGWHWNGVPHSSFTIGIDSIDRMVQKLHERSDWPIYKIKLGTPDDLEIVTELRRHTDAILRVDANGGWTVDQAIDHSRVLADLGVEFIEQPLPADATVEDKRKVFQSSALPVIADEDCRTPGDVEKCDGLFHGINVKLCKCGGLSPAKTMVTEARQRDMKTMVGCMIESSIGIAGAAQLLPYLDYADLDGAVLLREEPASGMQLDRGRIESLNRPGCGASLDRQRLDAFLIDTPVSVSASQSA